MKMNNNQTISLQVLEIGKPEYDAGSMYRYPANHIEVKFNDGEKLDICIGNGEPFACGLCYQPGEDKEEYGRLAIEAVLKSIG